MQIIGPLMDYWVAVMMSIDQQANWLFAGMMYLIMIRNQLTKESVAAYKYGLVLMISSYFAVAWVKSAVIGYVALAAVLVMIYFAGKRSHLRVVVGMSSVVIMFISAYFDGI